MPIKLEVVTPFGPKIDQTVDEVLIPAEKGEMGILPGHVPLMTAVKVGALKFKDSGGTHSFAASIGFAEVIDDTVKVVIEACEAVEEIDAERAKKAEEKALAALEGLAHDAEDRPKHERALARARNRIALAAD